MSILDAAIVRKIEWDYSWNSYSLMEHYEKHIQLDRFGRILDGSKDVLQKYILKEIEITDEFVLKMSNKRFHPILFFSNKLYCFNITPWSNRTILTPH